MLYGMHLHTNPLEWGGGVFGNAKTDRLIVQTLVRGCTVLNKNTLLNIVLTKMTPFNIQFGVKCSGHVGFLLENNPCTISEKRLRNQRKHALLAFKN